MALIVEDGTGLVNAESYATVVEADAYHLNRGNEASWNDLDVEVKEQLLRKATDYMQQAFTNNWRGWRTTQGQALDWPRQDVLLEDSTINYWVENNVIPVEVKNACCDLALIAKSGALMPTLTRAKSSFSAGEISVTYDPSSPEAPRYNAVRGTLQRYLWGGAAMKRLNRA